MKALKYLLPAFFSVTAATYTFADEVSSTIAARSMQCYALYEMLYEEDPEDDFRNRVLYGQAVLMGTIHVLHASKSGQPMTQDRFVQAHDFVHEALLSLGEHSIDELVDRVTNCEGWREEIVMHMAAHSGITSEIDIDSTESLMTIPEPKASYPITGVTRQELTPVVAQALKENLAFRDYVFED